MLSPVLKNTTKKFFFANLCRFFLHVVIKNLNEKKNIGIFESHSKIGQLENIGQLVFEEKWPEKLEKT